jgi:hypothetical protein
MAPRKPIDRVRQFSRAGWVAGGIILTERVPDQDRMRIADFGYGPVNSIALAVAVVLVLLVVMLVRRRPGPTAP